MTYRPGPGDCIYCLQHFNDLTWDHVFPESWYPNTTPEDLEKWQVPACKVCNNRLGAIEDRLRDVLVLCMDPRSAQLSGVSEKVLRSLKPEFARNERDRQRRIAKRKKLEAETTVTTEIPATGIFPGFGPQPGVDYGESYRIIQIPLSLLEPFDEKVIRGLTYKLNNVLIGPEYNIGKFHVNSTNEPFVDRLLATKGAVEYRGPGFEIRYAKSEHGSAGIMMKVIIWGQYKLYGVVYYPEDQKALEHFMLKFIIYTSTLFGSYAIGRISHILGGHLNTPHHWIYGIIALIIGIIFRRKKWGIYLILFGVGFIISDFKDLLDLKFYGPDAMVKKKFWGID